MVDLVTGAPALDASEAVALQDGSSHPAPGTRGSRIRLEVEWDAAGQELVRGYQQRQGRVGRDDLEPRLPSATRHGGNGAGVRLHLAPVLATRKRHALPSDATRVAAEVRTGTSSWTSEAWWGRVYPPAASPSDRLGIYASLYDCVEVDATYYSVPASGMVAGWYARTPPGFLFALKFPRELLDPKKSVDAERIHGFVRVSASLGEKLGPLLLQFPPWVKPGRSTPFLWALLETLPPGVRYAVELRDAAWYTGETRDRLLRELRDRQVTLAWSSLSYVEVPPEITTDEVYLRFIGDHTSIPAETHGEVRADRTDETKRWADRLRAVSKDLRRALVFFNNHYAGFAPESVNLFRELMGLPPVAYGRFAGSGAETRAPEPGSRGVRPKTRRIDEFG